MWRVITSVSNVDVIINSFTIDIHRPCFLIHGSPSTPQTCVLELRWEAGPEMSRTQRVASRITRWSYCELLCTARNYCESPPDINMVPVALHVTCSWDTIWISLSSDIARFHGSGTRRTYTTYIHDIHPLHPIQWANAKTISCMNWLWLRITQDPWRHY